MAKKSIMQRNFKRIDLYQKLKSKRDELKRIRNDKSITLEKRFEVQAALTSLSRDSSKTRIRNRCLITGRGRGVYRKFNLSRICFRQLASMGEIPGVKKASW